MYAVLSRLRVANRLALLQVVLLVFIIAMGVTGIRGMLDTVDKLERVNNEVLAPTQHLAGVRAAMLNVNLEILRAFQHEPRHQLYSLHDHPVSLHLNRSREAIRQLSENWQAFTASHTIAGEEATLVRSYEQTLVQLMPLVERTLSSLEREDYSFAVQRTFIVEAQSFLMGELLPTLGRLVALQRDNAERVHAEAHADYRFMLKLNGALIAAAVLLALGIGYVIACSITRPLGEALRAAERIAEGKLDQRIEARGDDELSRLMVALGKMQDGLHAVLGGLQHSSGSLSEASHELTCAADSVSVASGRQSEAASSMAASVEEMTVSINHVSDSANEAANLAKEAGQRSQTGAQVINEAVERMRSIAQAIQEGTGRMNELRERTGEISRVIGVIREVADQTNLLALNAAIEAARAGEQGRGFAVVADEVRKLAERTAQSTTEITRMIESIHNSVGQVSQVMEEGVARASHGVEVANQAGEAVAAITGSAAEVTRVVSDISAALKEQGAAASDIARNVEQIAQMAEQNTGVVADANAAAQTLRGLALDMEKQLKGFRL